MYYLVKSNHPAWLGSSLPSNPYSKSTIELLSGDGCGVGVPADPLLAVSPLLRTILRDHLAPVYSPPALTLQSVPAEVLKIVGELLTRGTSSCLGKERVEEINQVFKMLGIETVLECSQLTHGDHKALVLDMKVKVEEPDVIDKVQMPVQVKVEVDTSLEDLDDKVSSENDSDITAEGSDSSLKLLNLMVHEAGSDNRLICSEQLCGKKFGSHALLDRHVKSFHLGKLMFFCDFCPKKFHTEFQKEGHVKYVHTALESFHCPECNKKFKSRENTYKHLKEIHLKRKAFVCKYCGRSFSQNSNMQTHVKAKHSKQWKIIKFASSNTDSVSLPSESDHMHVQYQNQEEDNPNRSTMDEKEHNSDGAELPTPSSSQKVPATTSSSTSSFLGRESGD